MAWLEKRTGQYRIVFRFAGPRFGRTLKTKHIVEATASLARLEDDLRRVELGVLPLPERGDLATFLLSDGKANGRPTLSQVRSLHQLFDSYFARIPEGSLEQTTIRGMETHINNLKRILVPCQLKKLGSLFGIHTARTVKFSTGDPKIKA